VIGLRGKRLLSVRYSLPKKGRFEANFDLPDIVVNIDLRTGKTLTATDVFRPETLTPTGIANLVDRMVARTPADRQDLAKVCFITPPSRKDFDPGGTFAAKRAQPPKMSPFFTANGLTVVWSRRKRMLCLLGDVAVLRVTGPAHPADHRETARIAGGWCSPPPNGRGEHPSPHVLKSVQPQFPQAARPFVHQRPEV
jgi:hypothetical protein